MKIKLTRINQVFLQWQKNHKGQRLGQFLINTLVPHETNSPIFYENDAAKAYALFVKRYADM